MFGLKTVDGVLAALVKAHNQLGDVVRYQTDKSDALTEEAFALLNEAVEHTAEAARASQVRARLATLLGFNEPDEEVLQEAASAYSVGEPAQENDEVR